MRRAIKGSARLLPAGIKSRIRSSAFFNRIEARRLASTDKRLDVCAAQVAHVLHLSGLAGKRPLQDKSCVELGAGWVLSHAVVFYLLGAKRVLATDIQHIAYPPALRQAIRGSTISVIRDILSPFEEHDLIRTRLDRLHGINAFSFDTLRNLGIEYVAPIDLSSDRLKTQVDFIFSNSVLEYVPVPNILKLLNNLTEVLSDGGKMIHRIHLEDPKNSKDMPFGFLGEPIDAFTVNAQGMRGNRVRGSHWAEILSQVKDADFRFIYQWSRLDRRLPDVVDPSIRYVDADDLAISHLGVLIEKKAISGPDSSVG